MPTIFGVFGNFIATTATGTTKVNNVLCIASQHLLCIHDQPPFVVSAQFSFCHRQYGVEVGDGDGDEVVMSSFTSCP